MFTYNRPALDLNGAWTFCPDPMQRCRRQPWWKKPSKPNGIFPCWDTAGLWNTTGPSTWKVQRGVWAAVFMGTLWLCHQAGAAGDTCRRSVVEVSARADPATPAIVLSWPLVTNTWSYTVYRRNLDDTAWGAGSNLGMALGYTDTNVTVGAAYEYRVDWPGGNSGYVYAGLEVPLVENRGKLVLLVDSTVAGLLSNELARLNLDLVGDGWTVLRRDVPRDMAVTNVKALVKAHYDADPANVKSLFVFGHVPVPYSGNSSPDGHGGRALPTDLYYAEMAGTTWTDNTVSNTSFKDSDRYPYTENWNIPGDGKFDQNALGSMPELESGRVDLYGMPTFSPLTEVELLRRYLDKDHAFRHARVNMERRGLVNDTWNLTTARDGWRNFAPMFGAGNVVARSWWDMETNSYLWAYSCGYGDWQSDPRSNFAAKQLNTVFTMRFGSWSVDWNDPDNVPRCILASAPSALTCSWSGGPYNGSYWYYHPMALGYTAGYSARYTQRNINAVYMELLGDPTLRMHPVATPSNLTATTYSDGVVLNWDAAPGPVRGYAVYRAATADGPFVRLAELVSDRAFQDSDPAAGACVYMVRAVVLEQSESGTYLNPSQGIFVPAAGNGTPPSVPTGLAAGDGTATDRVRLAWSPVSGATAGYTIWRSATADTGSAVRVGTTPDVRWDDVTAWEGVTNTYWVKAANGAGDSGFSVGDSGFQGMAPALPPANADASDGLATNLVRVTWTTLPRQTVTYEIWRSTTSDPLAATFLNGPIAGTNYDDTPLPPGTPYFYWVKSVKATGTSGFGAAASGYTLLAAPAGPAASDGAFTDRLEVTWSPAPQASGYEVWRAEGSTNFASAAKIAGVTGTNYSDIALSAVLCSYWVRATNAAGAGSFSGSDAGFFKPVPPPTVWASDGAYTDRVALAWDSTPASAGYEIWRHTNATLAGATRIGGTAGYSHTMYADTNVMPDVTYYYWIRATNLVAGDFSAPDSGFRVATAPGSPPPTPTAVSASDGLHTNSVRITWTASAGATSYQVWLSWDPNEPYWFDAIAEVPGTNYVYAPVYPGEFHAYAVSARNAAGDSELSAADMGYPVLPAPTGLTASDGLYTDCVALAWSAGGWEDGFVVWRSLTNDFATALLIGAANGTVTYADTNVTAGIAYCYWVQGSNAVAVAGASAGDRGYRAVAAPPESVWASDGTYTDKVQVTWNASAGAAAYDVWRAGVADPNAAVRLGGATATNYADTGAAAGLTNWYWVKAVAGGVTSGFSVADSGFVYPPAPPPPPPAAVSAGDGTLVGKVRVEWSPVAGSAAYQVWRNTAADTGGATFLTATAETNWDDSGVSPDTAYYYWIAATNAAGVGGFSAGDRGYSRLPAPAGVMASDRTYTNRISVTWPAVTGATAYEVWRGAVDSESNATLVATVMTPPYDDVTAADWTPWYYRIKAANALSTSDYSASAAGRRAAFAPPAAPAWVVASDGVFTGIVRVTWAALPKADGYSLWRGADSNALSAVRLGGTTNLYYDDVSAGDVSVWYWARATNANGVSGFGPGDTGWAILPNGTNALPYVESFEAHAPGFTLPGTHGWYADNPDAAVVSADAAVLAEETGYSAACGLPLATNHTRVLRVAKAVSAALAGPRDTAVWCDVMVRFTLTDNEGGMPAAAAGDQFRLCALTNGHLALWHRLLPAGTKVWTQLDPTVQTDCWYRITVRLDYGAVDPVYTARYWQVDVDGVTVSNAAAYSTNDGTGTPGGTWFAAACASNAISFLRFAGNGFVDDIVVGTNNPHHRLAPLGTPEWWLLQYGLTNAPAAAETSDTDRDGRAAWEEFVAGTDPANAASVFQFTAAPTLPPGPRRPLRFDSVPGRHYRVSVSTNLLFDDWQAGLFAGSTNGPLLPGPCTATGGATTIFVEPSALREYYRGSVER